MRALSRHPLVATDLREAYNWYEDQCPGLGVQFQGDFKKSIHRLLQDPWLYSTRFADLRRLNLESFPYGLFYVIREPEVWLLAVLHGSRDTEEILSQRRRHFLP
jgi:toxin ParE1/3/4